MIRKALIILFITFQNSFAQSGFLDSAFNGGNLRYSPFSANEQGIRNEILPNGDILVSFSIQDTSMNFDLGIGKMDNNGQPIQSFGNNGFFRTHTPDSEYLTDIRFYFQENKIYGVGGIADSLFNNADLLVARFDTTGFLDSTFGQNGLFKYDLGGEESGGYIEIQSDGNILILGGKEGQNWPADTFLITRVFPDGMVDPSFGTNGWVKMSLGWFHSLSDLKLLPGGDILVAGAVNDTTFAQDTEWFIARFSPFGLLVNSFGDNGIVRMRKGSNVAQLPGEVEIFDDKIYMVGSSSIYPNGRYKPAVFCLDLNSGTLDPNYGNNGFAVLDSLENMRARLTLSEMEGSGGLIAIGYWDQGSSDSTGILITRISKDGFIDKSGFGIDGISTVHLGNGRHYPFGTGFDQNQDLVVTGTFIRNIFPGFYADFISFKVRNSFLSRIRTEKNGPGPRVFPNPSQSSMFLDLARLGNREFDFRISDINGRTMEIKLNGFPNQENSFLELEIDHLDPGTYLLQITGPEFYEVIKFQKY